MYQVANQAARTATKTNFMVIFILVIFINYLLYLMYKNKTYTFNLTQAIKNKLYGLTNMPLIKIFIVLTKEKHKNQGNIQVCYIKLLTLLLNTVYILFQTKKCYGPILILGYWPVDIFDKTVTSHHM